MLLIWQNFVEPLYGELKHITIYAQKYIASLARSVLVPRWLATDRKGAARICETRLFANPRLHNVNELLWEYKFDTLW